MSSVLDGSSPQNIARAAEILQAGGLVAFPTETVYGLGADAASERAVRGIFAAKGRPADHPLIVHVGASDGLERWASDPPAAAWQLAQRFWPGPLTLILDRHPEVPTVVTGGQETIGLRMPDHPVALALLKAFGRGIAAPSANRFGRVSPTTADHVVTELGESIDCVLDGGPCPVGLESTILDLSGTRPRILRPGAITAEMLADVLGTAPATGGEDGPRVPGRLPAHYAPSTPMRLLETKEIEPAVRALLVPGRVVIVLAMRPPMVETNSCRWWTMPTDAKEYARVLYARLRQADTEDCHCILVERPPVTAEWEATHDRLARAAAGARLGKGDSGPGEPPPGIGSMT